jgi:UDP-N-acetylglucosamine 2-epimerase (non-hydrolysing)
MQKTRISTIVGTRPEIIRLSKIIKELDKHFNHRLIHTGQNPDPLLKDVFFEELNIRKPDLYFGGDHNSLGEFLANLFIHIEKELKEFRPDGILILGDTNSALSSIIAKRYGITIYHLEAGNRSFDQNVPEEINRKLVDHISDFNLVYSEIARSNLIAEGLHPRHIALIGSPLYEVLNENIDKITQSNILTDLKLEKHKYFLVSAHRQENVDNPKRLKILVNSLIEIQEKFGIPILVSTHPRTKKQLEKNINIAKSKIIFHEPFGFIDYNNLQLNSRLVLSDSGTISEESTIMKFNAVTIRDSMERPEALESGSIVMCGINANEIIEAIHLVENSENCKSPPFEYEIRDTSSRVVKFISSTVRRNSFWIGLRETD